MTVRLVPFKTEWSGIFQITKDDIEFILKDKQIQVEHIGSTSIQGLTAKPIIDIGIGINRSEDLQEIVRLLSEGGGYIDRGDRMDRGGYLMVKGREDDIITHHVHILHVSEKQWTDYLKFRDLLRGDEILIIAYENLKRELLVKYNGNRVEYTKGKNDFIQSVLRQ